MSTVFMPGDSDNDFKARHPDVSRDMKSAQRCRVFGDDDIMVYENEASLVVLSNQATTAGQAMTEILLVAAMDRGSRIRHCPETGRMMFPAQERHHVANRMNKLAAAWSRHSTRYTSQPVLTAISFIAVPPLAEKLQRSMRTVHRLMEIIPHVPSGSCHTVDEMSVIIQSVPTMGDDHTASVVPVMTAHVEQVNEGQTTQTGFKSPVSMPVGIHQVISLSDASEAT